MTLNTEPTDTVTSGMQPLVLAAGLTTYQKRVAIGRHAETVVCSALAAEGYEVTDLNAILHNCAFVDLVAVRDDVRILIQVKGATISKYSTPPAGAAALKALAAALDHKAAYAFVNFSAESPPVALRFATPDEVEQLAAAEEAWYAGTNRYHVYFDNFTATLTDLPALLR